MSYTDNNNANELKFMETLNSIKIISNAVLIGIQKSLNEYGKQHDIPPLIKNMFMKQIQTGGQYFINSLNNVKNITQLKDFSSKTLNALNENITNQDFIVHKIYPDDLTITSVGGALQMPQSLSNISKKVKSETRSFRNRRILNSMLNEITKELGDNKSTKMFKYVLMKYLKEYIEKMDTEDVKKINNIVLKYTKLLKGADISKVPVIMNELKNDLMLSQKIRDIKDRAIEETKKLGITDVEEIKRVATEKAKLMLTEIKGKTAFPQLADAYANNIPRMKQLEGVGSKKMEELNEMLQNAPNDDNDSSIASILASSYATNVLNTTTAIVKKIVMVTDFFISNLLDFATQGALNMPLSELTKNTNTKILVLAAYLRNLSNSPEQLEAIREISEALGKIGIEMVDVITPAIQKMTDKLLLTFKEAGSQAAEGAMKTFIAISSAIISAIPGVGGVINLVISLAIGFNSVMKVVRTFTENNAEVVVDGAETTKKSIDILNRGKNELSSSVNKLLPPTGIYNALGGGRSSTKKHRISTTKKRLHNTINHFNAINSSKCGEYINTKYVKYTRKHV